MIAGKDDEGERRGVNPPAGCQKRGIAHPNPLRERGIIAEIAAALIPH